MTKEGPGRSIRSPSTYFDTLATKEQKKREKKFLKLGFMALVDQFANACADAGHRYGVSRLEEFSGDKNVSQLYHEISNFLDKLLEP